MIWTVTGLVLSIIHQTLSNNKPNILVVLADDVGETYIPTCQPPD